MKRVRRRRSSIFDVVDGEPESEQDIEQLLMAYESPEDRVRELLDRARDLCDSWKPGSGNLGSDAIVEEVRQAAYWLRDEFESDRKCQWWIGMGRAMPTRSRSQDPWRVADFAIMLGRTLRDLETNERLERVVHRRRQSESALANRNKERAASDSELETLVAGWAAHCQRKNASMKSFAEGIAVRRLGVSAFDKNNKDHRSARDRIVNIMRSPKHSDRFPPLAQLRKQSGELTR